MLFGKLNKKEYPKFLQELLNVGKQKTKIFEIKISYLFESVEFERSVINNIENIEANIVNQLKGIYQTNSDSIVNLFYKKDFFENLEKAIFEVDEPLLIKIKADGRYNRLKNIVSSLQVNIFGI